MGELPKSDVCQSGVKPQRSGAVLMTLPGSKQQVRVVLSVYSTNFDRYAVLSSDKALCKDCGYINLKTCGVRRMEDKSFQVLPRECHSAALTFTVSKPCEMEDWLSVFQCPVSECPTSSPKKSLALKDKALMPTLEEDEEEALRDEE